MMEIKFGVLAPKLKTQLAMQNLQISEKALERFEKIRMAISMVRVHGIATEKEADNMYKRLFKQILREGGAEND